MNPEPTSLPQTSGTEGDLLKNIGRTLLFCPANREDRYVKALNLSHGVILDLEDAVPPAERAAGREMISKAFGTHDRPGALDPDRVIVRVNPVDSDAGQEDLDALSRTRCRQVMVAKAEQPEAIGALTGFDVVALIETLQGLDRIDSIAVQDNCRGLMWGGDDFTADLGGRASRRDDGSLLPHAQMLRMAVLVAARRHGRVAIDGPSLVIFDVDALDREATEAAAMGFMAKAAVHPKQVEVISAAFAPDPEQVERANRIVAAAEASGGGVVMLDGLMIDGPIVHQARAILADAEG